MCNHFVPKAYFESRAPTDRSRSSYVCRVSTGVTYVDLERLFCGSYAMKVNVFHHWMLNRASCIHNVILFFRKWSRVPLWLRWGSTFYNTVNRLFLTYFNLVVYLCITKHSGTIMHTLRLQSTSWKPVKCIQVPVRNTLLPIAINVPSNLAIVPFPNRFQFLSFILSFTPVPRVWKHKK